MQELLMQLCTEKSKFDGEWKWQAAGMSYLVKTKENRFIMIDGGETEEDTIHLINVMRQISGEEHPTVALWIITHPHLDHYGALKILSEHPEYAKEISICQLCYQLPNDAILPASGVTYPNEHADIQSISKYINVPVTTPHTNDILKIDGLSIRFFFTPEDCLERLRDVNELSLMFQITGENKSVMFTGDAYERTTRLVAFRFWDELQSDYCQLSHHGLNGGSAEFYARVNATDVLIPSSVAGERDLLTWKPGACARQFAARLATNIYRAYEGDITLPL